MRSLLTVLAAFYLSLPLFPQCGFKAEPVAVTSWHRSEGWKLPGITDGKVLGPLNVTLNGKAPPWPTGVTVSEIVHAKGYHVSFPAGVFDEYGKQKRMRPRILGLHRLLRWELNGKPYAYTYELWPEGMLCDFSVDIVDDEGDGVFRLLESPGHNLLTFQTQAPALPARGKKPTS
jgi:hypothetical protein